MSQVDRTQAAFGFQHRGDTGNACNGRLSLLASHLRVVLREIPSDRVAYEIVIPL